MTAAVYVRFWPKADIRGGKLLILAEGRFRPKADVQITGKSQNRGAAFGQKRTFRSPKFE